MLRRAAFDVGSGATKMQVSDVNSSLRRIVGPVLFGQERPVPFGAAWLASADGRIPPEMITKGIETLRDLKAIAIELGASSFSAVATEVFRKAENGEEFLTRVRSDLDIPIEIVTQQLEAELGFATALAFDESADDNLVSWDSGGASFQITICKGGAMQMYLGALGTSRTLKTLVGGVRGLALDDATIKAVNPVTVAECDQLLVALRAELPDVPEWLSNIEAITAIGGPNSMFSVASSVLGGASEMSSETIHDALLKCLGKTDSELQYLIDFEFADPVSLIVPKLCLFHVVALHLARKRLRTVRFQPCIGSCAGLLVTEGLWRT